jgi:hypothetical protein
MTLWHSRNGQIAKRLGEGRQVTTAGPNGNTSDARSIVFSDSAAILPAAGPVLTGSAVQTSPSLPVDMWTIGFQPNGCASHAYRARKGAESMEMLAFAHIPTGNHNNQEEFIFFDFEGRGAPGRGPRLHFDSPALRESVRRARRPGSKGRAGIFCQGRGQKIFRSRGPARAFDRARRRAAFAERRVGTEGWAFLDRTRGQWTICPKSVARQSG